MIVPPYTFDFLMLHVRASHSSKYNSVLTMSGGNPLQLFRVLPDVTPVLPELTLYWLHTLSRIHLSFPSPSAATRI